MEASLGAIIVLVILALVTVANGVRTVPQGSEWIIERFGKYHRTLKPGLSVVIPFFDRTAYKVVTKDIVLDIEQQEVITRDNAVIHTNAVAFIKITDPVTASYGVEDLFLAVRNLVQTSLRSIIGEMDLDSALSSREQIKGRLTGMLSSDMQDWGVALKSVEIQDIKPSPSMQQAMEQQAAAERERKAVVTRAEGAKQAAILEAEGRLESAKRDADAEVKLAEGSKLAIMQVRETTDDPSLPLTYLLGQRYVSAMQDMASSPAGRYIVLPADLLESVRGLLSGGKKP